MIPLEYLCFLPIGPDKDYFSVKLSFSYPSIGVQMHVFCVLPIGPDKDYFSLKLLSYSYPSIGVQMHVFVFFPYVQISIILA